MAVADRPAISAATLESLWKRHQQLAVAINNNPNLRADRATIEASARAERAFREAYLRFEPMEVTLPK
jgi:hypothetical protein